MSALDPPYGERDPGGMTARIDGIPEQIEAAVERGTPTPWPRPAHMPSLLAVGAMGGSAIAADLTAAWCSDRMPRPLVVVRDYRWPAFVTRESFALLCSYSGNTEETLALYAEAGRRGVPRAALTTGGALATACERDGVPWVKMPGGSPPRAALFGGWVPLTLLLEALDWCDDPRVAWREAAAAVRSLQASVGSTVREIDNPAKRLARRLLGKHIVIWSGPGTTAAAATRVRQQLNENAKLPGHSAVLPEHNHNEIVGWERPGAFHRGAAVLLLRDREDSPEVARRLDLAAEYAARQGAEVHELPSMEGGRLARLAALVAFGDYLSLYVALASGVDPTPIASIDEFKRRLAEAGEKRE